MTSIPKAITSIEIDLLAEAPLKNEEIVELTAAIASAESVAPYHKHLQILRDRYDMTLEVRPLEIEVLSMRDKFPLRVLRNFYTALEDQGYHSLIKDAIIGYQEDKNAAVYISTLAEVFGVQPDPDLIQGIIKFIDNSNMDGIGVRVIRRHFQQQLDKVSSYAPIPGYIDDFRIRVDKLSRLKEKEVSPDLTPELIAQYILTQMSNLDLYTEEEENAKEVLIERIEKMPPDKRAEFVNLFKVDEREIEEIRTNRDVFRVYGPVNPYPDTDFSNLFDENGDPDINVIFGGARMFTDNSLEYDYDNDLPQDDWFLGYCLQCSARIRSYHHAVREPELTGGWRGCFCSWPCVRRFIEMDTEHDSDLYNLYVTKIALTREYEREMNEIGIQDRDYELIEEPVQGVDQDEIDDLVSKLPEIKFEKPWMRPIEDLGEGVVET